MWLLAEGLSGNTVFFLAAVLMVTGVLLLRTHRQIGRRTATQPPLVSVPRPGKRQRPTQAPAEVERWEVQMHDLARDLSAQLDSKMSALQHLIRTAEQQCARLESLLASVNDPASGVITAGANSQTETQASALGSSAKPTASALSKLADRRYDEIYALADAGQTSQAIAERLGTPVGEVELILGLRRTG